jgi:acyl-CoA thioester hydrolase
VGFREGLAFLSSRKQQGKHMHERLNGFPIVIEISVAWGEMDSFQHVNNIVYLRYFESARIAYFERLGIFPRRPDSPLGVILASISCSFKFPLTYPDMVWAGARVTAIGADRVTMQHLVVSQRHARVAAEGEGVVVSYDYGASRKAPLPDDVRRQITALEGMGEG